MGTRTTLLDTKSLEEVVNKAWELHKGNNIGQYNLFNNKCEHFATFCKTSIPASAQTTLIGAFELKIKEFKDRYVVGVAIVVRCRAECSNHPSPASDWTTLYSDLNPASLAKTLVKDAALSGRPSSLAMKRAWRFSVPAHAELSCLRRSPRYPAALPLRPRVPLRNLRRERPELGRDEGDHGALHRQVLAGGEQGGARALDEKADPLLLSVDGLAFVELLKQLDACPHQALEVFFWKRKLQERGIPMTSEEYVKGITVTGRIKDVDLALELFVEAMGKRLKATSTYNALMSAYMYNGLAGKCQKLF
ncbi:hypothetical protein NL676_020386 [Syzygium grande]|nr:hypothetical protein NL676_020386 [Syzygium grande]